MKELEQRLSMGGIKPTAIRLNGVISHKHIDIQDTIYDSRLGKYF